MKLTNGEIYGAVNALGQLADKELPVKVSYWLARLANKLDGAFKSIDKVRNALVTKHGAPNPENRGAIELKPGDENWEKFLVDYNELMIQEEDVDFEPVKLPIKLPQEVDGKSLSLKFNVLIALENFVEVE